MPRPILTPRWKDEASIQARDFAMEMPERFGQYIGTVAGALQGRGGQLDDLDVAFASVTPPAGLPDEPSPFERHLVMILVDPRWY